MIELKCPSKTYILTNNMCLSLRLHQLLSLPLLNFGILLNETILIKKDCISLILSESEHLMFIHQASLPIKPFFLQNCPLIIIWEFLHLNKSITVDLICTFQVVKFKTFPLWLLIFYGTIKKSSYTVRSLHIGSFLYNIKMKNFIKHFLLMLLSFYVSV